LVFSGLARFFRFGLVLTRFGLVLARFFSVFFSVWVWFDSGSVRFFLFQAYKTGTEPVGFFKILIGFFSQFGFFGYFFWFNQFFDFFVHP
jgi:hypothetical protein